MRNKILLIAAIAFSINANSQHNVKSGKSQPVYTDGKIVQMLRNIDNSCFSIIDPSWEVVTNAEVTCKSETTISTIVSVEPKDCFKMVDNKMFVVKNGTSTSMNNYQTLKDGTVVMINGVVITNSGKIVHLNNGDCVDMKGNLSCIQKAGNCKEQATL